MKKLVVRFVEFLFPPVAVVCADDPPIMAQALARIGLKV